MRDYDEQFCCYDDTVCYQCGAALPHEIEEGTVQWDGFCSERCARDNENGVKTDVQGDLADFLDAQLGREGKDGWSKSVYKGTDCGAWIRVDGNMVTLGSIVEGSDVEVWPHELIWPFTAEQFWGALDEIEKEASFYWDRDNSVWFSVDYTPVGKEPETFYGKQTWGELYLDAPEYVREKVRQFFEKDGVLEPEVPRGIALGVTITEYINDCIY